VETMTPLHSAIASARLISSLSAESNSWCLVPQGVFYVPVYFMLNHALDVAYMGREIDCHRATRVRSSRKCKSRKFGALHLLVCVTKTCINGISKCR
jgi:hypothetical protein